MRPVSPCRFASFTTLAALSGKVPAPIKSAGVALSFAICGAMSNADPSKPTGSPTSLMPCAISAAGMICVPSAFCKNSSLT